MSSARLVINNVPTSLTVDIADTFIARARGLMGKDRRSARPVLLTKTSSIHTFFMRFPLNLYFLDASGRVVRVTRRLPSWRIVLPVASARQVLEIPSDTPEEFLPREGDTVSFPVA